MKGEMRNEIEKGLLVEGGHSVPIGEVIQHLVHHESYSGPRSVTATSKKSLWEREDTQENYQADLRDRPRAIQVIVIKILITPCMESNHSKHDESHGDPYRDGEVIVNVLVPA